MKTDLTQTICLANIKGGAHEAFVDPLRPETTALIIVDMQGPLERAETEPMRTALANCVHLLEMARSIPIPVIHVHLGCWTDDSRELSLDKKYYDALRRRRGRGQVDRHISAPGRQPLPGVEPRPGEIVQQKTSGGAFATTGLAGLLHNLGVRDLVMCGQLTHGCLGMTAIEAVNWSYIVTMVDDASASPGCHEGHLAVLRLFDQCWGRVRSTDEVIAELTSPVVAENRVRKRTSESATISASTTTSVAPQ